MSCLLHHAARSKHCQHVAVGKECVGVSQYGQKVGVLNVRSVLSQVCNEVVEFRLTLKK